MAFGRLNESRGGAPKGERADRKARCGIRLMPPWLDAPLGAPLPSFVRGYFLPLRSAGSGTYAPRGRTRAGARNKIHEESFCLKGKYASGVADMIRKLTTGQYRLYSRKKDPKTGRRRNLGTFKSRAAAEKHERAVQYFKRH